jgi:Icc-related predicted phosphoesterase
MAFWKGYFTGDVHGSEITFKKVLKAGKFYDVNAVIVAGDLVGKGMIPITKIPSGYECEFGGEHRVLSTESELASMIEMIGNSGFYHYVTTKDELADLYSNQEKADQLVNKLLDERMTNWVEQMEASTKRDGITYYVSPGNDDPYSIDPILSGSALVVNPEERLVALHDKIDLLTCGWTNPTPWNTERELPEDKLFERLEGLVKLVPDVKKCIFSFHAPPFRTKLDVAPTLDKNLRMQSGLGGSPFQNVGSTAVRAIIEKYPPLVSVHGHIHESPGRDNIGKTCCFNAGSEYAQGVLRGIILIFNIDKQAKYVNYLSVTG